MTSKSYGIHWFRRDLRVAGNPALRKAWQECDGRVIGWFNFDRSFLGRPDFSYNRFQFFLESLIALREELEAIGSCLVVTDQAPASALEEILNTLQSAKDKNSPVKIFWNRDYEPFAIKRDQMIQEFLDKRGVKNFTERDHLVIEPHELRRGDSLEEGYQVYSPFSRKWMELFSAGLGEERISAQRPAFKHWEQLKNGTLQASFDTKEMQSILSEHCKRDLLSEMLRDNELHVSIPIPKAGSLAAWESLQSFKDTVDQYGEKRDFPAIQGTSRVSIFLKNGTLTTSQIIAYLNLKPYKKNSGSGRDRYFSELVWREFYYHILSRHPRVESEAFLKKHESIPWENSLEWFEAWKNGQTGYPIVDAGMRELKQTGWMHNRVRMIVASFLTKDLLIDWKWGERYFMETLLDGDLAPNNGGWQWAASTGCDPQPYFRIFNPKLQSERFDAEGVYIRRYVPELATCEDKDIHDPPPNIRRKLGYPDPIVDHQAQKIKALRLYKSDG